jgi:antitoxin FitA
MHMSKMVQIRNMPDSVHRILKSRAAMAGMSLSDYLLREMKNIAERPTMEELTARLKKREPASVDVSIAQMIREDRESH